MTGEERRGKLCRILADAQEPVSGGRLGEMLGVSRQVVVQDIALIRSKGMKVTSTNRGYLMAAARPERTLKVRHAPEQTREELTTVVDLGGCVEDVSVNHRTYGRIAASLGLSSRRDVDRFMDELDSGASSLLMGVTSGYHFHRISAEREEVLDEIERALSEKGFCAERLPYERDMR